jgi:hypothetical protein
MIKQLTYKVSHDWTPYRWWIVQAESEIEARMIDDLLEGIRELEGPQE